MWTDAIIDTENWQKKYASMCPYLTFISAVLTRVLETFPCWRNQFACGILEEEEVGKEESERCAPQQLRGVSLMAGGGRKSQDLMCTVKLSNSPRPTSDGSVGGRCTMNTACGRCCCDFTVKIYHIGCCMALLSCLALHNAKQCNTLKVYINHKTRTQTN